jgi:integrase
MENLKFYLSKRDNGYYRIGYFVGSKLCWKSTKRKHKAEALSVLRDFESSFVKPSLSRNLSSFKAELSEHVTQCMAAGTVAVYGTALTHLISIIGDMNLRDITARHADAYKAARLQSVKQRAGAGKVKPTTVNCEIRTLRAAFNTASKWGLTQSNPFKETDLAAIPDKAPLFIGKEEFTTLTNAISEAWLKRTVIFAALTGMRRGEILNMKWEHVDLQRNIVSLESSVSFKTKAGRRRVIPLSDSAVHLLTPLIGTSKRGFVFENNGKQIGKYWLTHRFKHYVRECFSDDSALHWHNLRHTTASWLVQSGSTLYEVQTLLGHSNSKTTQIYAHLLSENQHSTVNRIQINNG